MNIVNKALIAVLIVQVALAALTLMSSDSVRLEAAKPIIEDFSPDTVERIEIYGSFGNLERDLPAAATTETPFISMARQGDAWILNSHYNHPASPDRVRDFLRKIDRLASRGPLTTVKARQKQLGVADNAYLRKVVLQRKGADPIIFYVGQITGRKQTPLRLAGKDDIHEVSDMSPDLVSILVSSWVDDNFFRVSPSRIKMISVKNYAGELTMEPQSGGKWRITMGAPGTGQVAPWPPSQELLNQFLEAATNIRAVEPGDPNKVINDEPVATLTVTLDPGHAETASAQLPAGTYTIEFFPGKKDQYFARRTGMDRPVEVSRPYVDPAVTMAAGRLFPSGGSTPAAPAAPTTPGQQ